MNTSLYRGEHNEGEKTMTQTHQLETPGKARPFTLEQWGAEITEKLAEELRRAAHHEAGHAVIAHVLGIEVKWAFIGLGEHPPGSVWAYGGVLDKEPSRKQKKSLEHSEFRTICTLTGPIADWKSAGRKTRPRRASIMRLSTTDWKLADTPLRRFFPNQRERHAHIMRLRDRASDLVKEYWWAIEDVAHALLHVYPELRGADIARIIEQGHVE
jgi:hypothetical protein